MLERDATIASIWDRLSDPRLYSARVFQKAMTCRHQHGSCYIQIGITGTGQKPCYRLTYMTESDLTAIWGSFWDMGDPLDNERSASQNWSTAKMSIDELEALIRKRALPQRGA